jgi:hypothetical protein
MLKETPTINILTAKLPFDLSNQIYNEYQNRLRESKHLIENYDYFKTLHDNIKTVELLLSLSIFHKRVISNLDAAIKFYGTVTEKSDSDTIKIGSYSLTLDERNKLLAIVMNYNELIRHFSIPPFIMEYYETKEFLRNLINLKKELLNVDAKKNSTNKNENTSEDGFPF